MIRSWNRTRGLHFEGEKMTQLCQILAGIEDALIVLERRGISLKNHAERINLETGQLPVYHVTLGRDQKWIGSRKQLDKYLEENDLIVDDPNSRRKR